MTQEKTQDIFDNRGQILAGTGIELAKNYRYSRKQLKKIEKLIEVHHHELIGAWNQHFPG